MLTKTKAAKVPSKKPVKSITVDKPTTKKVAKKDASTKATKTAKKQTVELPAKSTKTVKIAKKTPVKTAKSSIQVEEVIVNAIIPAVAPVAKKPAEYLNNRELLEEVKKCKKNGDMSDRLARMLTLLCSKYAKRGNFINYSYNDDMQSYAMYMIVRTWASFNPEKSNNPFAFYTQCIRNSFIQFLNQEKRQRNIRDEMLIDQGLNPSYSFDDGNEHGENGEVSVTTPGEVPECIVTEREESEYNVD